MATTQHFQLLSEKVPEQFAKKSVITASEKHNSSRKTIYAPMDYNTPVNKRVVPI